MGHFYGLMLDLKDKGWQQHITHYLRELHKIKQDLYTISKKGDICILKARIVTVYLSVLIRRKSINNFYVGSNFLMCKLIFKEISYVKVVLGLLASFRPADIINGMSNTIFGPVNFS